MATIVVPLRRGWKIGAEEAREVELREATAGDVIDATAEAERIVPVGQGVQLVASPFLLGLGVLRRQIERIGSYTGPVTVEMMRKLNPADLDELQSAADKLLDAGAEEIAARGRVDAPPAGAGP